MKIIKESVYNKSNKLILDESLFKLLTEDLSYYKDKVTGLLSSDLVDTVEETDFNGKEAFKLTANDGKVLYLVPSTLSQVDVYDNQGNVLDTNVFWRYIVDEFIQTEEAGFVYQIVGGDCAGTYTIDELKNLPCFDGKYSADQSEIRNNGGFTHRKELDNQPELNGYLGPIFNGWDKNHNAILRYETQEVYDRMSENFHSIESSLNEEVTAETFSQWFDKNKYHQDSKYYPFDNYAQTFKNAEVLRNATAEDIRDNAHQFYDIYDVDSADREYAFQFASEKLGMDYDDFYYAWLKKKPIISSFENNLDESTTEESLVKNPDQEGPYSKKQIEQDLYWLTDKFTRDDIFKCGYKEEAEYAEEILSKHYASVELDKVGSWFQIEFKDAIKKDVKEEFSSNIDLDRVVIDVANLLDEEELGDNWIEVFPVKEVTPYKILLEITGADETTRKAFIYSKPSDSTKVCFGFRNGSEGCFTSAKEIARFIAGEYGLTLNESKSIKEDANKSLASRLVDFIKDYDFYHYSDTLEVGDTEEDVIKEMDRELANPETAKSLLASFIEMSKEDNLDDEQKDIISSLISGIKSVVNKNESKSIREGSDSNSINLGDTVRVKVAHNRIGTVTKIIGNDLIEVEFEAEGRYPARNDRYYISDVELLDNDLTICPNCGGTRFNDNTGFCIDCVYDEKSYGDIVEQ